MIFENNIHRHMHNSLKVNNTQMRFPFYC